jgi:viologen exporter family transport system ATP-binding protein
MSRRPLIKVRRLRRLYAVRERPAGLRAALRSVVQRTSTMLVAVSDVSFDVQEGEVVGFLGPNGAGKTTTLKVLSGLLFPTAGNVQVIGFTPSRREHAFLRQITLLAGNRNQLVWDLPVGDSFEVRRAIYGLRSDAYHRTLDELVELFDLAPLLPRPVRQLSLGERMKCELAGALLHRPRVLFLDEPTLGLDVPTQRRLRTAIAEYNQRYDSTVLLTSHSVADVEALCKRVIVMDHGIVLFDGELTALVQRFASHKTIVVELDSAADSEAALHAFRELVSVSDGRATLRVPKSSTTHVAARLLSTLPVTDVSISDPPIEEVIEQVFAHR